MAKTPPNDSDVGYIVARGSLAQESTNRIASKTSSLPLMVAILVLAYLVIVPPKEPRQLKSLLPWQWLWILAPLVKVRSNIIASSLLFGCLRSKTKYSHLLIVVILALACLVVVSHKEPRQLQSLLSLTVTVDIHTLAPLVEVRTNRNVSIGFQFVVWMLKEQNQVKSLNDGVYTCLGLFGRRSRLLCDPWS